MLSKMSETYRNGVQISLSAQLEQLTFNEDLELIPSNIAQLKEKWSNALKSQYGCIGGFITFGS